MAKYLTCAFIISVGVFFSGCSSDKNDSTTATPPQKQIEIVENPVAQVAPGIPGTYLITDAKGTKWNLILEEDETATLVNSNNQDFHGIWTRETDLPKTYFPQDPPMAFPASDALDAHYMYLDPDAGKLFGNETIGNPDKTLDIKKIE